MKSPENCDTSLRSRKRKESAAEKSVKNVSKTSEKMETDVTSKVEQQQQQQQEKNLNIKYKSESEDSTTTEQFPSSDRNFRIRLEFDPMSIALLTLAIITRFFKLSEPRNVV